jgi:hypothetical protein
MDIRLKTLRYAAAAVICCALAVGSGFAQETAPSAGGPPAKAGSDAPRGDGAGPGGAPATNAGSDTKAGNTGDRGAGPSHTTTGPQTIELGRDARKGPPATGTPVLPSLPQSVTLSHGINLVTPDNGYAGLLRRANRKALIANAPKKPVGPLTATAATPPLPHGREGVRNAVGLLVPAGSSAVGTGAGQHVLSSMPHNVAGPSGTGAIGTGGAAAGADARHLTTTTPPGVAMHTAGINGTTMGHIASGPGMIGGPVKDRSAINGTGVRPKH